MAILSPQETALADALFKKTVTIVGAEWDKWAPEDRTLVSDATIDAARVLLLGLTDPVRAARLKTAIDSQLADIKLAAGDSISSVIWAVAKEILAVAVPILIQAVLHL